MYERSYGEKYDNTLSTKTIAALVRGEIKADLKKGLLPAGKYSVTSERFAGGSSITVGFSPAPAQAAVFARAYYSRERIAVEADTGSACGLPFASKFGQAFRERLERKLRQYNHDGSDSMTDYYDVNFYAHVDVRVGTDLYVYVEEYKRHRQDGALAYLDITLAEMNPAWDIMLRLWEADELRQAQAEAEHARAVEAEEAAQQAEAEHAKAARHLRLVPTEPPTPPQAPNPAWARLALAADLTLDLSIPGLLT